MSSELISSQNSKSQDIWLEQIITPLANFEVSKNNYQLSLETINFAFEQATSILSEFINSPDVNKKLAIALGKIELQTELASEPFQFPNLLLINSSILGGALGGYASQTNEIFFSDSLIDNPILLSRVFLEEIGHAIDAQINSIDSPGDEGAIFASLVQREVLSPQDLAELKQENDRATVVINGERVTIEQANFIVTNTEDSGAGSLRQAITEANNTNGADTITFDANLSGQTITLTGEQLEITDSVTIEGLGAEELTIDATGNSRAFSVSDEQTDNPLQVSIEGVTITGGSAVGPDDNTLTTDRFGGGIFNREILTLTDVAIEGNSAERDGGGIYNDRFGGILTVIDSLISENQTSDQFGNGAGIGNGGTLNLNNTTISTNSASSAGGGITNFSDGQIALNNSRIEDNTAYSGGGIDNDGIFTISSSTIANNVATNNGGGIRNAGSDEVGMTISRSTISGNSALVGGGIDNANELLITNSTVSSNSAETQGGGINNTNTLTLVSSTIAQNTAPSAGGLFNPEGELTLINSLIAGNDSQDLLNEIQEGFITRTGVINSNGVNLVADGSFTRENILNVDPLLSPLQDNGGSTLTHLLLEGSPAIDVGETTFISDEFEQRGQGFDRVVNGTVDLGAVEVDNTGLEPNTPPNAEDDEVSTIVGNSVIVNVLENDNDEDGDPLTVTIVTPPEQGVAEVVGENNAQIAYSSNQDFSGTDTLVYEVSDGRTGTDTATVTIQVEPIALDDAATTTVNAEVAINVFANDLPINGEGLTLTFDETSVNGGAIEQDADTDELIYAPPTDFTGTDTFNYTISDGSFSSEAVVSVTVEESLFGAIVVDFEEGFTDQQEVTSPISVPNNEVTLTVGSGTTGPGDSNPFIAQVGDPQTAFIPNDDAEEEAVGNFFLTDESNGPNNSLNYFIEFDQPIPSLSVDLLDFVDEQSNDASVSLTVFSDSFSTVVGEASSSLTEGDAENTDFENLSVTNPSGLIQSASIVTQFSDLGTGIDNITLSPAEEEVTDLPTAPEGKTGESWGDPHIVTFDEVAYDFQAAAEFILAQETEGTLEVQVRQEPVSNNVSVNTAVATTLDGETVMIDVSDDQPLQINGNANALAEGESTTVGNGEIFREGNTYTVIYPGEDGEVNDGDERLIVDTRSSSLDVEVQLAADRAGGFEGLLGNADMDGENDIATADGEPLSRPLPFDQLYGDFRSDWRVDSEEESLFTYDEGESPDSFYQPDFPSELATLDNLDPEVRAAAEQAARDAGLQEGTFNFDSAVLDFALTQDEEFLEAGGNANTVDNENTVSATEGDPYADEVIAYEPDFSDGNVPTNENFTDPVVAVGAPDYNPDSETGSVSLGSGGRITLQFTDNVLTGSGDNQPDLRIFEVGPDVENTFVEISEDGEEFISIGEVAGDVSTLDIDASLEANEIDPATEFRFVRLQDNPEEGDSGGGTPGADIDAIEVITPEAPTTDLPTSPEGKIGISWGDPHLVTFDEVAYDFQAAAEFILAQETEGTLEVQVRQEPVSNNVSVNTAVATTLDGETVMIDVSDDQPLQINGNANALAEGESTTVGNGEIFREGNTYTVIYPGEDGEVNDGDERLIVDTRSSSLDVEVQLAEDRAGGFEGLLGNADMDGENDIATADGEPLPRPLPFDELYGDFRSDWRVDSQQESLFTYDEGESPDSFYQPEFPSAPATLDNLDPDVRAAAEQAARDAGLQEGTFNFNSAVLDFALTEDETFLESAQEVPTVNADNQVLFDETVEEELVFGSTSDDTFDASEADPYTGNMQIVFTGAGEDTVDGTDATGNNRLYTSSDNDRILAAQRDRVFTNGGDDEILAASNNRIFAGAGNDLVDTSQGSSNNRLYGQAGDDELFAGNNDVLLGGEGEDRLFIVTQGDNILTGNTGADQFWITTAEVPNSLNTVTDFTSGEDVIGVGGFPELTFADLTLTQEEADTIISFGANTGLVDEETPIAVLQGIQANSLIPENFIFDSPDTAESFNIELDYRFAPPEAFDDIDKARLEEAATIWESFIVDEFPEIPAGSTIGLPNPQSDEANSEEVVIEEPLGDLRIFLAAKSLDGPAAFAGPRIPEVNDTIPDDIFEGFNSSDFEPRIGALTFNTDEEGSAIVNVALALHEMGHVLGIGSSPAFDERVNEDLFFEGETASALNNGEPIPILSRDEGHIEEGFTLSDEIAPLLGPGVGDSLPTVLDLAILKDIGYEIPVLENLEGEELPTLDYIRQGTFGDDNDFRYLYGHNGEDTIFGGDGNDFLIGSFLRSSGNIFIQNGVLQLQNYLQPEDEADQLFGEAGDDWLIGNGGDDHLAGGTGDDELQGDLGIDTFIFEANNGADIITDFDVTNEIMQIASGLGFTTGTEVLETLTKPSDDVSRLTLSAGNTIDVLHESMSGTPLTATNFQVI
ncbi:VWD domain-containing protein [Dactylococcopsis salina]|uniref:von Willebrand factor type D domain protein,putative calcium-binding protein n=1 Tax=Dactylococcopsis salina (strain PCC 8305) TaxID=13035 RepID=K9YTV0_DACS8|nr:VWD domain-containing protein [Dactylococcopsis salina]AFZ49765.1 von Willebrand factor type D domain protein,putative calcium-binding protein [Dactylococcopsis salina PCC 8305]